MAVLRMLVKGHKQLASLKTQAAGRLHAVLATLIPGGLSKETSPGKASVLLRGVRPATMVETDRKRIAHRLPTEVRRLETEREASKARLAVAVEASGTTLTDIYGVGPAGPGRRGPAAVWSAHRRRKVKARVPMGLQILGQLDLVFPELGDCTKDVIRSKGGHVILRHCPDPVRLQRMGPEGLRAFVGNRGVRMARSKAALIVATAQRALLVPNAERRARMRALQADLAITTE